MRLKELQLFADVYACVCAGNVCVCVCACLFVEICRKTDIDLVTFFLINFLAPFRLQREIFGRAILSSARSCARAFPKGKNCVGRPILSSARSLLGTKGKCTGLIPKGGSDRF